MKASIKMKAASVDYTIRIDQGSFGKAEIEYRGDVLDVEYEIGLDMLLGLLMGGPVHDSSVDGIRVRVPTRS